MPSTTDPLGTRILAWTARLSLSLKLSLAFALVLLIGVLGLGVYANHLAKEQAIRAELATLTLLSERLAGQVDTYLSTTRSLASHLVHTQDVERFLDTPPGRRDLGAITAWLDIQVQGSPGLSAVFIMTADGQCVASSNRAFVGRDFAFRTYFQQAVTGRPNSSDWFIGSVTRTPRISSASPIRSRGRITGVLVTEFEVEELQRAIRSFGQSGRSAMLINHLGILLSHSNSAYDYHAIEPIPEAIRQDLEQHRQFLDCIFPVDPLTPDFPATVRRVIGDGVPRTVRYLLGDLQKWGGMSPVKGQTWVVVASVPEAEILRPSWTVWHKIILMGVLSSGGAFLLALFLGRILLRPLQAFSEAITAFGRGDSGARLPVQVHPELEHLARTFNTMADTIQGHQENLEGLVKQRTLDLEQALADMKSLQGMIPICSYCKKIRDDGGSWWQLESYIQHHSEAEFSHGICPDCRKHHFPEVPLRPKRGPSAS